MRFAPILPVLFYTGSRTWDDPITITTLMDMPEELVRFVPQHDVLRLNLKATPPQSLVASGQPVGWALSVMQQEDASPLPYGVRSLNLNRWKASSMPIGNN
ncbi:hypothetical protein HYR99_17995 [Candidatus Poribacteria bacterium]|nr:hypothetical protein [Candidatus Poribacteria bacterium]